MTSRRISSRFPPSSRLRFDNPVMFPPGRARLATNPFPMGSGSCAMTMGIVEVACFAARVDVAPGVTITSTLRRTRSAASARYSMEMFSLPRTQARANLAGRPRCGPRWRKGRQQLDTLSEGVSSSAEPERTSKAREHSAKSKNRDFFLQGFFPASIHLLLDTRLFT
jgi:hypothetical protein